MQDRIIYLILFVGCIWLVLDMFFGGKKLGKIASRLVDMTDKPIQSVKQEAKELNKVPTQDEYKPIGLPNYDEIFRRSLPQKY